MFCWQFLYLFWFLNVVFTCPSLPFLFVSFCRLLSPVKTVWHNTQYALFLNLYGLGGWYVSGFSDLPSFHGMSPFVLCCLLSHIYIFIGWLYHLSPCSPFSPCPPLGEEREARSTYYFPFSFFHFCAAVLFFLFPFTYVHTSLSFIFCLVCYPFLQIWKSFSFPPHRPAPNSFSAFRSAISDASASICGP